MDLVRNQKRTNIARYFLSEQFDWLISRTSEADQTRLL